MPHEIPDKLVEVATRALDEWPWRTGSLTISTGMLARAVLSAVSEAGWVRAFECSTCEKCGHVQAEPNWCHECGHRVRIPLWADRLLRERDAARAQAEALREDGRKFADWLERDRRESDKVLCVVQSMRRAFRESQEPDHAA